MSRSCLVAVLLLACTTGPATARRGAAVRLETPFPKETLRPGDVVPVWIDVGKPKDARACHRGTLSVPWFDASTSHAPFGPRDRSDRVWAMSADTLVAPNHGSRAVQPGRVIACGAAHPVPDIPRLVAPADEAVEVLATGTKADIEVDVEQGSSMEGVFRDGPSFRIVGKAKPYMTATIVAARLEIVRFDGDVMLYGEVALLPSDDIAHPDDDVLERHELTWTPSSLAVEPTTAAVAVSYGETWEVYRADWRG